MSQDLFLDGPLRTSRKCVCDIGRDTVLVELGKREEARSYGIGVRVNVHEIYRTSRCGHRNYLVLTN